MRPFIFVMPLIMWLGLTFAPLQVLADEPPILTVSGDISQTNRGPSGEEDATMLGAHDIAFVNGFAFTRADLAALPQTTYRGRVPGSEAEVSFTGPMITDVLAQAGANGGTVTITALDGYGIEMEVSYIETHKPILAVAADGVSLAIGDLGPAVSVFPPTDDAQLADDFAARQTWAAFHIGVK